MKMVITLISHGIFFQILCYIFKHCPATGMKKCDEASPSIILQVELFGENAHNS